MDKRKRSLSFFTLISLLAALSPAAAYAAEQATVPAPSVPGSRFHLELGYTHLQYRNMDELYTFNPAADLLPAPPSEAEIDWSEQRTWMRLHYDLYCSEQLCVQPGVTLGAVRAQFEASNSALHFTEKWRTKPAVLWGLSFAGELRAEQVRGPFIRMQYLLDWAEAAEELETVTSNHPEATGDSRDAFFRWQESKAFLGAGYRWRTVAPMAGISYTDFRLQKRLHAHIPAAGVSSTDLPIVRALNSADSEYHYRNAAPWAPFLALEWEMTPDWTLVAVFTFRQNEDLSLSLRKTF